MSKKIRVNKTNSKVLAELIEYDNNLVYPGIGKLVEYNGPFIRVTK